MKNVEVNIFKALSEPIRVRIMVLLSRGELCVCDLMAVLNLPQSTTSRHLSKLKAIDLISDRRNGKWKYYRLNDKIDFPISDLNSILNRFSVSSLNRNSHSVVCPVINMYAFWGVYHLNGFFGYFRVFFVLY